MAQLTHRIRMLMMRAKQNACVQDVALERQFAERQIKDATDPWDDRNFGYSTPTGSLDGGRGGAASTAPNAGLKGSRGGGGGAQL